MPDQSDRLIVRLRGGGLAAYVYTGSLDRALRMQDALQVGMLGINTGVISDPAAPFGGVKQSGLGREGGTEGIEEYLTTQYVGAALPAPFSKAEPQIHRPACQRRKARRVIALLRLAAGPENARPPPVDRSLEQFRFSSNRGNA
jgi:hypothetical protein